MRNYEWPENMPQDMRDSIEAGMDKAESEYKEMQLNAERYRKLRDMGDHQTFGEYVVVKCDGLPVGTQTWSGKRLDSMLDERKATDAKPK